MAKKPSPQTPGGKGKGGGGPPLSKAGGGWVGHAPAHHHPHHHHHHKPGGGPMTPGGPGGPPLARAGGGWVGKAPQHKKAKKHPKRKLAGTPLPGAWILGGNDAADNCALVAVANVLLASTGRRVDDAELLRLHDRAGPLSIPEALAAVGACAGALGIERQDASPVKGNDLRPSTPLIAGLATPHGPHAGLLLPGGGLVTWGGEMALPGDWDLEECWAVTW